MTTAWIEIVVLVVVAGVIGVLWLLEGWRRPIYTGRYPHTTPAKSVAPPLREGGTGTVRKIQGQAVYDWAIDG